MAIDRAVLRDASGRCLRRPLVYLDQSTLVDAYFGKRGERADVALNAELAAIIEDVASRGTLCLSVVHVIELTPWPSREDALSMAAWLDGLNPLWFQMEGATERELANEVRRRLALKAPAAENLPIHHAMTAAVRENMKALSPKGAGDFLSAPDVASLTRKIHGNVKLGDNAQHVAAWSVAMFRRTYDDRISIPEGTPPEHVEAVANGKVYVHLQVEARREISTAPVERDEDYPSDLEISRAVREALDDPDAIPLNKIGYHLQRQVAEVITRQDPTSRGFNERFKSFVWDTRHALAAGVVDVFTCDSYVDSVMTDFRTARGMERQVSMHGRDRAALVAELRRQCAEPHESA